MKKIFLTLSALLLAATVSFAAETPGTIYAKIIDKSYIGKYSSVMIDKEISSSQLPNGMNVKSRTYYSNEKFREETTTQTPDNKPLTIVTIFTSSDTYISYDSGENFFAVGASFLPEVSGTVNKNIDPFTPLAVLKENTEKIDGTECFVIEDNGGGLDRTFYVDKKNYNVLKSVISNSDMLLITELSDYKKVDKYTAPFKMKILMQQKTGEKQVIESAVKFTALQFNPKVNDSMFIPKNVSPLPNIPGLNVEDMIRSMF